MKIKLFTLSVFAFVATNLTAQRVIDRSNCREGEEVEYCTQHKKMAAFMQNEDFASKIVVDNKPAANEKATIYYIPVVFHVLHNNGVENISDDQIMDALDILNRDFALLNADANSVHFDFNASNPGATATPANADIQFRLATKAPNGTTCFNGITRTVSATTSSGDNGFAQVTAITNGNNVFNGTWPGNKYLNIFVVADAGGAAGYTTTPNSTSMANGIWILHNYVGSIGTGNTSLSRALTHEVGHWLDLEHTWGPNNNPGNASSCSSDDGVGDTPNTIGVTSCLINENTCGPRANVENYMDYSYCSKMFTAGQVTRMRNALNSGTGGRSNVRSAANLTAVGADGVLTLCKTDFSADKTVICAGATVTFDDGTYNAATGWTWTFAGGSPASSNAQNPTVTYNSPGVYQVSLTATDGSSSDNETKTSFITVMNPAATLPFYEGFESYTTLDGSTAWAIDNPGNNQKFEITNTAAHTGSKSVKLANFGQPTGGKDELIAAAVDLSNSVANNLSLSFRYAYRKKTASDLEYLRLFISNDCGNTWSTKKTLSGNSLGSVTAASAWTPTASDWVTVHVSNLIASNMVANFRYKFQFQSDNGNNIYIDDINIYNGPESDVIITNPSAGLNESDIIQEIALYPNPSSDEVNLKFTVGNNQAMKVAITDVTGKQIQYQSIQAAEGTNLVLFNVETLSKGAYFVTISSQGMTKTLQFVKN